MMELQTLVPLIMVISIPIANGAMPGTFFWKPRLGVDLTIPTTEHGTAMALPTRQNIEAGKVVMIDAYRIGLSFSAIALGLCVTDILHLNPLSASYHTNGFRWALRHLSLIPEWLGGKIKYSDTHKVWTKRFYYMDAFIPHWMRNFFPYVDNEEFDKEQREMRRFRKYAEPAFGKHYRYPSKVFNNFKSQESTETIENLDSSDLSLLK